MCNEILDDKIQDPNGTAIAILIGKLLGKEEEVLMLQDKAAGLLSAAEDRDLSGS